MSRHVLVGDVHGCIQELEQLMADVGLTDDDTICYLGDLVDKGPYAGSAAVVRFVRQQLESRQIGKTVVVTGNHEEKHLKFRRHYKLFKEQGKPVPMKRTDELFGITALLSEQDIAFLDTVPVLYHKIPEHDALVVHAGVPPSVTFLPPLAEIQQMPRSKRDKYEQLLRVRYVNPSGWMVSLGDEKDEDRYWADVYQGELGHVYFGHQPFHMLDQPKQFKHATGIDLGAVFGNYLCAAILEVGQPVRYLTVKARSKYAPTREEDPWEK